MARFRWCPLKESVAHFYAGRGRKEGLSGPWKSLKLCRKSRDIPCKYWSQGPPFNQVADVVVADSCLLIVKSSLFPDGLFQTSLSKMSSFPFFASGLKIFFVLLRQRNGGKAILVIFKHPRKNSRANKKGTENGCWYSYLDFGTE